MMSLLPLTSALAGAALLAAATPILESPPCGWLASDLIGTSVISQQGEKLGQIEEIVVHPGGEASYAVLSFGGWLGMGEKLFAMPWTVLRMREADAIKKDGERSLVLPLDKERLKSAPGFDKKSWPTTANADWTKDVDAFYAGDVNPNTKHPIAAVARTSVITWKVTELKGTEVKTPTGDALGELEEVVLDTHGRVNYVALSVGGFLGVGDTLVAVPWDSLVFSLAGDKGDKKSITLASTKDMLAKAPRFKVGKEARAEMCDPNWISRVYAHFSCPTYWTSNEESSRKPGTKN